MSSSPSPLRSIHVRFFAVLREQAGTSAVEVNTVAATPAELYAELQVSHRLTFRPELLRVALNERYVAMDSPLKKGDQVVFIPPVAGG